MPSIEDIKNWNPDTDRHPLEAYEGEVDVHALEHKTVFTVNAESHGRVWESQWLIPKDITEVDWIEIQRMLKLAMTTLCRLPLDEAIGVVDPEGYEQMKRNKEERERLERERLAAVPGEDTYVFKEE